jgi:anti-sigma-K factor RskA
LNIEEYISSGILEAYALGELSSAERLAVEKNLAQYPELRKELTQIEEVQEQLMLKAAVKPRASVKSDLFNKLSFKKPEAKVVSMQAWKFAAAASIVIALVSSYMAYEYYGRWQNSEQDLTKLIAQNRQMAQDYSIVNKRLDKIELDMQITDNPAFTRVVMKHPDPNVANTASIYWNAQTKEVYLSIQDMKQLAQENQYQLWAMIDGKPVDAGVFDMDTADGLIRMKEMKGATHFAVTIEPRGGRPAPTMANLQMIGAVGES